MKKAGAIILIIGPDHNRVHRTELRNQREGG